jgi:hypothetical protein
MCAGTRITVAAGFVSTTCVPGMLAVHATIGFTSNELSGSTTRYW